MCFAMWSFYSSSYLLKDLNHTNIVLISKCHHPKTLQYYRPISLCNFVYKVILKTIVHHLKPLMDSLIPFDQVAFIPSRAIQDNIIIECEAFHFLKTSFRRQYSLPVKLDMFKAYDQVDWGFLCSILFHMGFAIAWVQLIMQCISSYQMLVLLF